MQRRSAGEALSYAWLYCHPYHGAHHMSAPYGLGIVRNHFAQRFHGHRRHRGPGRVPYAVPSCAFPFERRDRRYLVIYLALGGLTACLVELPRRAWAHKHAHEFAPDKHDCMRYSRRSVKVAEDPYDAEAEAMRLKELTTAYQVSPIIHRNVR